MHMLSFLSLSLLNLIFKKYKFHTLEQGMSSEVVEQKQASLNTTELKNNKSYVEIHTDLGAHLRTPGTQYLEWEMLLSPKSLRSTEDFFCLFVNSSLIKVAEKRD